MPSRTHGPTSATNSREAVVVVEDDEPLQAQPLGHHQEQVPRPGLGALVVVARDRAARDHAAERTQRGERRLELVAADVVEVDVDPVGERLLRRCLAVVERLDAE